jgi:hypothetical protein
VFPVGEEVMGFENLIRFTVSYGRSKAGTESPICHYCRYYIQKLGCWHMSQDEGLTGGSSKIG